MPVRGPAPAERDTDGPHCSTEGRVAVEGDPEEQHAGRHHEPSGQQEGIEHALRRVPQQHQGRLSVGRLYAGRDGFLRVVAEVLRLIGLHEVQATGAETGELLSY